MFITSSAALWRFCRVPLGAGTVKWRLSRSHAFRQLKSSPVYPQALRFASSAELYSLFRKSALRSLLTSALNLVFNTEGRELTEKKKHRLGDLARGESPAVKSPLR